MASKELYKAWYKSSPTARTEYFYIVAYSHKQAWYYFMKQGYTKMYDYCIGVHRCITTDDLSKYPAGTLIWSTY